MSRFLVITFFILIGTNSFGTDFIPCKLIFKDSSIRVGFARIPDMMDELLKYRNDLNSKTEDISSDDLIAIVFTQDGENINYQRVFVYKYYGNKKVNKKKSWLKVLKTGYLSLYYGFQQGMNSPSLNMKYLKKSDDSVGYFISGKYSGGLVLTVGAGHDFRKNASFYLRDYKELADKILNSEYKFEDIELVVDLYNDWKSKN